MNHITLTRFPAVSRRTSQSKSTLYRKIKDKLFPPPIRLGTSSVAWIEHEVDVWLSAAASGKTPEELRAIVASLVAARKFEGQA